MRIVFRVSMIAASFLVERAKGFPYRLLPVFHNRNFSYTNIAIRRSSGIRQDHPEDLTPAEIRAWIVTPIEAAKKANSTKKPPMPDRYAKLPAADLDGLVAYMASLK